MNSAIALAPCPCQFNALPTHGRCRGLAVLDIEERFHGRLDGLKAAAIFRWPRPIHEGKGECVLVLDRRATWEQRAALLRILGGDDTEPGATIFQIFSITCNTVHEPIISEGGLLGVVVRRPDVLRGLAASSHLRMTDRALNHTLPVEAEISASRTR